MAESQLAPLRSRFTLASLHLPFIVRKMKNRIFGFTGPMSKGEKFIVLDDDYISKFDEIVVIGDVHGCYDEYKELLKKVHANTPSGDPDRCLKIIVGDLVNKGPLSRKVLEAVRDSYPNSTLAVRGNHDEIVLNLFHKHKQQKKKLEAKNKWIEKLPARYIEYLNNLPYSITIPSLKCIIVHAGLDPSKDDPAITTPTNLMVTMRNIIVHTDPKTDEPSFECTKSNKMGAAWATFWPGPEHVYFGHDARRRLQKDHEFATGLDTGCVYGDRLSYVYVKGGKIGQVQSIKAKRVYEATSDNEDEIEAKVNVNGDEKAMTITNKSRKDK